MADPATGRPALPGGQRLAAAGQPAAYKPVKNPKKTAIFACKILRMLYHRAHFRHGPIEQGND
jgi:hypothetical protein